MLPRRGSPNGSFTLASCQMSLRCGLSLLHYSPVSDKLRVPQQRLDRSWCEGQTTIVKMPQGENLSITGWNTFVRSPPDPNDYLAVFPDAGILECDN